MIFRIISSRNALLFLVATTVFNSAISQAQTEESEAASGGADLCECRDIMTPTQVANAFWAELYGSDSAKQADIVSKYLSLITLDSEQMPDSRLDRLSLGEGAFLSFDAGTAHQFFGSLLEGENDLITQHAWDRTMQIRFRALEQYDETMAMLEVFYEKFPPSMENIRGRYQQVSNFASKYRSEGDVEAVAALIESELRALPDNLPHLSYSLMATFGPTIAESSRGDAIRELLAARIVTLRAQAEAWKINPQPASEDPILNQIMPDWYWRSQRVNPGESLQEARLRQLIGLLGFLENPQSN